MDKDEVDLENGGRDSSSGDLPPALARQSQPSPWKSIAKPSSGAWGSPTPSPGSGNDAAGFPALSSTSAQSKRNRHSPWHHQKPKINPYPPRSHEIAHRWLARDGAEGNGEASSSSSTSGASTPSHGRKTGVFTMRDIDLPPGPDGAIAMDEGDGEDADFFRGPVQMYGMSRVTVRDLSDPSLKGKNKIKRVDISQHGPQIYGRHYQPHVQKGKRPRAAVQAEALDENSLADGELDDFGLSSHYNLSVADTSNGSSSTVETLREIIGQALRDQRSQAAEARRAASTMTETPHERRDSFTSLYAKINAELASYQSVMQAEWLSATSSGQTLAMISSLPAEVEEQTHTVIQQGFLRLAAQLRAPSTATSSPLQPLLKVMDFSVAAEYHLNAHDTFSSLLRTFEVLVHGHSESAGSQLTSHSSTDAHVHLLQAIVTHTDLLLEQHRFAAAGIYSTRVMTACEVLRHLHNAARLHKSYSASHYYLSELIQAYHAPLLDENSPLSSRQFRFLLPLPVKTRLLRTAIRVAKESARRQNLWASFYSPRPGSSPSSQDVNPEDASIVTLHVERSDILSSAVSSLSSLKSWQFQQDLRVSFEGEGEEGVDSILGGVRKEWFTLILRKLFETGNLRETGDYATLSPDADADAIWCLGVMLGWSLFHDIPFGLRLPDYVIAHCLGQSGEIRSPDEDDEALAAKLSDLRQYDPRLVASLEKLQAWQPPPHLSQSEADGLFEKTFSLNFTSTLRHAQHHKTVALCPGGQHRHVTMANLSEYVDLLTHFLLYGSVRDQLQALHDGMLHVFPLDSAARALLRSYAADEVRAMIQGNPEPILVETLRPRVEVLGTRSDAVKRREDDTLLAWFWNVVPTLSEQQTSHFPRQLLSYITSSTHLSATASHQVPFRIHLVSLPSYTSHHSVAPLPWTSTCTMTLFLPRDVYRDEVHLKERLQCALRLSEGGGFGLK